MPTIMEFKAQMKSGFARPNLFRVEISGVIASKQGKYQMSCFQAQIPGHNLATTDKDIAYRSIAYQKIFSDVILGFYVDSNLSQLKYWQEWIDKIINKTTNYHNYYKNYIGEVKITQENRHGNKVATWTLHDAYPKQIDPIQLDYGTNDAVMTCNATITYRHFTVDWKTAADVNEKGEVSYAEPNTSDMNSDAMTPTLDKTQTLLRVTQEEFDEMYPYFDRMTPADQKAVLYLYGANHPLADSKSGGALHMVNT